MQETARPTGAAGLDVFDVGGCRVCLNVDEWRRRAEQTVFGKAASGTPKPGPAVQGGRSSDADASAKTSAAASTAAFAIAAAAQSTAGATDAASAGRHPADCPLDTEQLGRATWAFLHTTAAYYPLRATAPQRSSMRAFFDALGSFYPCAHCANYLRAELAQLPPKTEGRVELSNWLCNLHNVINARLGKPQFDCSRVLERWRTGGPGC